MPASMYRQWTFEQHRFELHGSTDTWIFFSGKYHSTTHSRVVESVDMEPQIQRTAVSYSQIFNCMKGHRP